MRPLPYVWPYALIYWVVFVWAFFPEFGIVRRAQKSVKGADSRDAGSLRVILLGMWFAFFAAFPLAGVRALQFPQSMRYVAFWFGIALLIGGSLLRRHCFRQLGTSFTGDVQTRADQQIVTTGAYRFVRHPAYAAGIVMYAGVTIGLANWGSTLVILVASIATYSYRIAVEERALLAAIGQPYRQFMATRTRLVPYIY